MKTSRRYLYWCGSCTARSTLATWLAGLFLLVHLSLRALGPLVHRWWRHSSKSMSEPTVLIDVTYSAPTSPAHPFVIKRHRRLHHTMFSPLISSARVNSKHKLILSMRSGGPHWILVIFPRNQMFLIGIYPLIFEFSMLSDCLVFIWVIISELDTVKKLYHFYTVWICF